MDTTQLLYLAGAFVLGFLVAWFAGRSGPKRALEECEANAHSLQRTIDERTRSVSKLEGQVKEQVAQVDRLGEDNGKLAAAIKSAEQAAADAGDEVARLQLQLEQAQSDRLLLETELGHIRDSYADTRSRLAALTSQVEADAASKRAQPEAPATAEEPEEHEDVSTALAVTQVDRSAEIEQLAAQVHSLQSELDAARASAARLSAQGALQPKLSATKQSEYAALAGDADRVVAALYERDLAVIDARNEVDYLRRTVGMLTGMGAELAVEVQRRQREQQVLLYEIAGLTAVTRSAETRQLTDAQIRSPGVQAPTGAIEPEGRALPVPWPETGVAEVTRESSDDGAAAAATALAIDLRSQFEECSQQLTALKARAEPLQSNLKALQAELATLSAAKADLEAQLVARQADIDGAAAAKADLEAQFATRETDLTDTREQLVARQGDIDSAAAAKAALEEQLQIRGAAWESLVARLASLSNDLESITSGEPSDAADDSDDSAPAAEMAALAATAPADTTLPEAARAADAAIPPAGGDQPATDVPTPEEDAAGKAVLAKLAAGVGAALALFKRKNAQLATYEEQLGSLSSDKSTLESTLEAKDQALVSTQDKVEQLQTGLNQRSVRFDALSLHASSLEAEMEVSKLERAKLEEQVLGVAALLQALAPSDAGNGSEESPTPDVTSATATAMPSGVEQLAASAAVVTDLVRVKEQAIQDAQAQLAALQEQLATTTAAKDALDAELQSKGAGLTDAETQLQSLQANFDSTSARVGELEDQIGALTSQNGELDSQLQQKEQALAEATSQLEATQADMASRGTELETLKYQVDSLQASVNATEQERQRLDAQLRALDDDLSQLNDAVEAGDDAKVEALAQKIAATTGEPAGGAAETEEAAQPSVDVPVFKTAGAVAVAAALQNKQLALKQTSSQLESVQQEHAALTTTKADLEAQLQSQTLALEEAKTQLATLQQQLDTATSQHAEEVQVLDQKAAELQTKYNEAEAARLELVASLEQVNQELQQLGSALEGDDDAILQQLAERQGTFDAATTQEAAGAQEPAKTVGVAAVAAALQRRQMALKDTTAQVATIQAQLEAALAESEAAKGMLAERESALQEVESRLTAVTVPVVKTVSDFKAAARAAADERGVEVQTTSNLQEIARVKHIGMTFEQRLYRAGAGTFWEVAHLTDDDLRLILQLTNMQELAMNVVDIRADALRLAEETGSVGLLSEGQMPDDFEPILGIGKVFEQRLYSAGIRTYRQLAETSEARLEEICKARKPLTPDYASWIRQARAFMETGGGS